MGFEIVRGKKQRYKSRDSMLYTMQQLKLNTQLQAGSRDTNMSSNFEKLYRAFRREGEAST